MHRRQAPSTLRAGSAPALIPAGPQLTIMEIRSVSDLLALRRAQAPPHRADIFNRREDDVVLVGKCCSSANSPRFRPAANDDRRSGPLDRFWPDIWSFPPTGDEARRVASQGDQDAHPRSRMAAHTTHAPPRTTPAPSPSSTRPFETWSAVTTDFARTDAPDRNVTGDTNVPSRSRSVRAPSAASVVQASSAPAGSGRTIRPIVIRAKEPFQASSLGGAPRRAQATGPGDALLPLEHQTDTHSHHPTASPCGCVLPCHRFAPPPTVLRTGHRRQLPENLSRVKEMSD